MAFPIDTAVPAVDDQTTNDTTPTLTGSGEPGEVLTIEVDADGDGTPEVTYQTTVAPDGTWSIDPDTDTPISGSFPTLSDNDTIDVTSTDPAGNSAAGVVTIDTTNPEVNDLTTNDVTPTLPGSGEPGGCDQSAR